MYSKGDLRYDREQHSKVIVVELLTDKCAEYVIKEGQYAEQTVYDFNSRYDYVSEEDVVVSAVYFTDLQSFIYTQGVDTDLDDDLAVDARADWVDSALDQDEVKKYYFPITRLTEINEKIEQ